MRRLCWLACLIFASGCATDPANGNGPFAEAFKDARGDNMRMRIESSKYDDLRESSPSIRGRN